MGSDVAHDVTYTAQGCFVLTLYASVFPLENRRRMSIVD
jgi:hypothetical protein